MKPEPILPVTVYEPVRVLFHLNAGYTKLVYERYEQRHGMLDNPTFDQPTRSIPRHLRSIGSRFYVVIQMRPRVILNDLSVDEIRHLFSQGHPIITSLPPDAD